MQYIVVSDWVDGCSDPQVEQRCSTRAEAQMAAALYNLERADRRAAAWATEAAEDGLLCGRNPVITARPVVRVLGGWGLGRPQQVRDWSRAS